MRDAGEPEWMQVTGLIHDVGKIMYFWGNPGDGQHGGANAPQWGLSGDSWVVGCALPSSMVFPELNPNNPDALDPRYRTETGIYQPGCGIQSLLFTWGHDEYLYQVLLRNRAELAARDHPHLLPDDALAMIRFHSAYPWHEGGAYAWAEAPGDAELKQRVRHFNGYDLYSKHNGVWDEAVLWSEFGALLDRFFPEPLAW
jgi:inositol oxygenase